MMDIEAFILIGGRSARLGTDKAFVQLGGETLAERAAQLVDTALAPARVTFAAGDATHFKTDLLFGLGRPVIADLKPGFGAWSALHASLAYARTEWIIVLACDLPFVSADLLRLLAGFADGTNEAVVPRQPDGRLQPLCAFYKSKPVLAVVEAIFTGKRALPPITAIFDRLATRVVAQDEYGQLPNAGKLFLNVNTPGDLEAALGVSDF